MHIRRGSSDLAKGRCFERAVIARVAGYCEPAFIGEPSGVPGDPGIMKLLVCKIRTRVAGDAIALLERFEDPIAPVSVSALRSPTKRSYGESPERILRT